ncbi:MAG TPA: hypothetical protein VFV31_03065 [Chitinophagaceae bacterium]|nr:hypothetical protein [Chitinophagaceae bacterium]
MKNILILFLFFFCMCNSKKNTQNVFEGSYEGNHSGISSQAVLKVDGNRLSGEVTLNNKVASINGTIDGLSTTGTLKDGETGELYRYTGSIDGDELRLTCTSAEDNSQAVELIMYRKGHSPSSTTKNTNSNSPAKEKNPDLVGVWKNTEVLGGGDMSFSTEYFMELKEDGTMLSWTGRSAGSGMSMESDEANASRGEWYTEGDKLYFIDPVTKNDAYTLYSVSETGLLLHNGGSDKKIFQRVQ